MTLKEKCRLVRDQISAWEVLRFFGYERKRKEGDRYFFLCPFHLDSSPSFVIKEGEKNAYCFGCDRSYSSIDLFMHFTGISSLSEALREMTRRFGVDLEDTPSSRPAPRRPRERKSALEELAEAEVRYRGKAPSRSTRGWEGLTRHGFSEVEAHTLARLLGDRSPVWIDALGRLIVEMRLPVGEEWVVSGYSTRTPNNGVKRDLAGSVKGLVLIYPAGLEQVRNVAIFEGVRDLLSVYLRTPQGKRERTAYVLHPGSLTTKQLDALVRFLRGPQGIKVWCFHDRDEAGQRHFESIREALREEGLNHEVIYYPPPADAKDWFEYYHPASSPQSAPAPTSPPGRERAHAPAPGC